MMQMQAKGDAFFVCRAVATRPDLGCGKVHKFESRLYEQLKQQIASARCV